MATNKGAVRAALALIASTAVAGTMVVGSPAVGGTVTVSENPSPSFQTNGRVNAIITVGNRIYIGGDFTAVRPAGSPAETNEVVRHRLAAFSSVTGQLLSWNPGANSTVNTLAASPNGRKIYVGGRFGRLGTTPRHNLGAVRAGSGKVTKFRADTDRRVLALATSGKRIYVGGKFRHIHGKARSRLAAVSTRGKVLVKWRPSPNGFVRTIALSPSRKRVFIGGDFKRVGAKKQRHLAKLGAKRGQVLRFRSHPRYPVVQIVATKHRLYLAGDGAGGHAASYTLGGRLRWVKQTDGAVHSVALLNGVLYVGGQYAHVCVGNTPRPLTHFDCPTVQAQRRRLAALATADGGLLPWDPTTDSVNGVFAVKGVGDTLRIGGDFSTVHGTAQQGYAAFRPPA